jgi:hypothetical protein
VLLTWCLRRSSEEMPTNTLHSRCEIPLRISTRGPCSFRPSGRREHRSYCRNFRPGQLFTLNAPLRGSCLSSASYRRRLEQKRFWATKLRWPLIMIIQNDRRTPSCISRPGVAASVIVPNCGVLPNLFGVPRLVWLRAFKASARI